MKIKELQEALSYRDPEEEVDLYSEIENMRYPITRVWLNHPDYVLLNFSHRLEGEESREEKFARQLGTILALSPEEKP